MKKLSRAVHVLALALLFSSINSQAQSTGTLNISITIKDVVRISGLNDVNFGEVSKSEVQADLESDTDFCVYRNNRNSATYSVKANAVEGSFSLRNTNTNSTLGYNVFFNDEPHKNGRVPLNYNIASNAQQGANYTSVDCTDTGPTANVSVIIPQDNFQAAPVGTYRGSLLLEINPI